MQINSNATISTLYIVRNQFNRIWSRFKSISKHFQNPLGKNYAECDILFEKKIVHSPKRQLAIYIENKNNLIVLERH